MAKFVVRNQVQLTALNQVFPLSVPLNAEDVAMRVLCRYEPEDVPPPPTILVITVQEDPNPNPDQLKIRNFMLIPQDAELPTDFAKYIGGIPFGPDKQLVYMIELLAINTTLKD
jgi:hypothetical protein